MKKNCAYLLCALFSILSACQEENFEFDDVKADVSLDDDKNRLWTTFAKSFAVALDENISLRSLVKKEALKQFDKDYDVLYNMIKDQPLGSGLTVHELLSTHIGEGELLAIEKSLPLLTIFVPSLPDFSAESWDIDTQTPEVAVLLEGESKVRSFDKAGTERTIDSDLIPAFPVVALKTNERVILTDKHSGKNARSNTPSFYQSGDLAFSFIDESFNGSNPSANAREILHFNLDFRTQIAWSLYEKGHISWQRDNVYYDINHYVPRGKLRRDYAETIASLKFMSHIDGKTAYNKISDQTEDAKYRSGSWASTPPSSPWLEGNFEFVVTVLINAKNGAGPTVAKRFPVEGKDLFDITYKRSGGYYSIDKVITKEYRPNIAIETWDIESYSLAWKFMIQEWDPGQTFMDS